MGVNPKSLAILPTPFYKLEATSNYLGVELYIKRDDMTEMALSGNKVRKLEYLLSDALFKKANMVVTCGGAQSNHCRATAIAASRLGLACTVFLRTEDPQTPPATTGNILLIKMSGATIKWIDYHDYSNRTEILSDYAGSSGYVIPEGGSNGVGAWGYEKAVHEILRQFPMLDDEPTSLVHACGSGGTTAGLALGITNLGLKQTKAAAINVCDDEEYFDNEVARIAKEYGTRLAPGAYEIVDGHVGAGYAKPTSDEIQTQLSFYRREGIALDPVYSGKAYCGLVKELSVDPSRFGRVIFIHTGGIFGNFGFAESY